MSEPTFQMTELREKQLAKAQEHAAEASALINQHKSWKEAALKLAPAALSFGSTKAQRRKAESAEETMYRLQRLASGERSLISKFEGEDREERRKAEEAEKARKAREFQDAQARLAGEAAAWLAERGKLPGRDYSVDRALETATEAAAQDRITARVEAMKGARAADQIDGGYTDFVGGDYCDGPCEGWDGESRRCQCGNRRVSWSWSGSWPEPYVYGEAY